MFYKKIVLKNVLLKYNENKHLKIYIKHDIIEVEKKKGINNL